VYDGICHLGEGPVWNVALQKLFWTDILGKRIWVYDPRTGSSRVFWEGDLMVGGFAFTRKGDLVLCAEQSVLLLSQQDPGGTLATVRKLLDIPMDPGEIFNDITVDPAGRILAGTAREPEPGGRVFRIERDKAPVTLIEGVVCSNGMTFSLDCRTLYHTNTGAYEVRQYDYDLETGEISNPRPFFQGAKGQGYPDGLTLDSEGCLWQAFWGAWVVRRFDAQGHLIKEIRLPTKQPSSVMFGGPDLTDLYITTAAKGAVDPAVGLDEHGDFRGGKVYRHHADVPGRREWLADLG